MATKKTVKKFPGTKVGTTRKSNLKESVSSDSYRAPSQYLLGGVIFEMPESPLTPARNEVETGISRLRSAEAFRDRALGHQRMLLDLADRVQRGDETLVAWECLMIAGAVRAYASQLYLAPPKGRGNPNRVLDPLLTVEHYIGLRRKGLKKYPAMDQVAEKFGVTRGPVKELLDAHDEQVQLWLEWATRWEKK